jgi:hypothetical protein
MDDIFYAKRLLQCYRVEANEDQIEGRGRTFIVGYFENYSDAIEAAKGRGGMGTTAPVFTDAVEVFICLQRDPVTYLLSENWSDAFAVHHDKVVKYFRSQTDPKIIRAKALSKLTLEEQKLLGLSKEK